MQLEWVNNASFILQSGSVRLICDPWIEGTIFNGGWKLLSETKFRYQDFADITHMWISHEHPDHFSPPNLTRIPEECRRKITLLFHHTKDRRVLKFCHTLGFQVYEMPEHESVTLADDFRVVCGRQGLLDSWLAIYAEGRSLLNMNDCVFERRREWAQVGRIVGKVDVLLSQFSYANWVGNPDDFASHKEHADMKRAQLQAQIRLFRPEIYVPFASFIYFSHAENFFMNRAVNHVRDVYEFAAQELGVPTVVLYPGDRWQVGEPRDSSESIRKYELDFQRAMAEPCETATSVPLTKLQTAAHAFIRKCAHKNKRVVLNSLRPSVVHLRDLGINVELSYRHGLAESNKGQPDIIMASDSLLYCLSNDWGGECLAINGRYEVPPGRNPQWFFWIFRVPAHNRIGTLVGLAFVARVAIRKTWRAIMKFARFGMAVSVR